MIMDESTHNGIPQSEILEAYKRIRSIDPDHPTYMVESEPYAYRSTGQATDILVTDVYLYNGTHMQSISVVGDGVRKAVLDTERRSSSDATPHVHLTAAFYKRKTRLIRRSKSET
jgi:hypothetical protein